MTYHYRKCEFTPSCRRRSCMSVFYKRRLRGLAVACWTTDHYHPCSNLGWAYLKVVSSFTSPHYLWRSLGPFSLPKVAVKHQSSSSSVFNKYTTATSTLSTQYGIITRDTWSYIIWRIFVTETARSPDNTTRSSFKTNTTQRSRFLFAEWTLQSVTVFLFKQDAQYSYV